MSRNKTNGWTLLNQSIEEKRRESQEARKKAREEREREIEARRSLREDCE